MTRFGKNGAGSCIVYQKKQRAQNGAVLNETIFFSWTYREQGRTRFCLLLCFTPPSLPSMASKRPRPNPWPTTPQLAPPIYPALSPDQTESGHFYHPSLYINTKAEKRRGGEPERGKQTERQRERKSREEREQKRREKGEHRRIKKKRKRNRGEEEALQPLPPSTPQQHRWPLQTTGNATTPGKHSALFFFAFISSLAMQDVHGAHLCSRGEAGYCAHGGLGSCILG